MRRETGNILLILLGGALVKLALTGEYLRYVKPAHQFWVIGGGAVMLALGLVAVVRDLRAGDAAKAEPDADQHVHSTRSSWLLLVPVLAVLLVAPPALGSDSVQRARDQPTRWEPGRSVAFAQLPAGDAVPLRLSDFAARAGWDDTGTLNGRTVRLTGFVVHRDRKVYLARMVIGCCAADASPVTVLLGGEAAGEAGTLPDDSWIAVTGEVVPGSAGEKTSYVPELRTRSVAPVPEPAEVYEY